MKYIQKVGYLNCWVSVGRACSLEVDCFSADLTGEHGEASRGDGGFFSFSFIADVSEYRIQDADVTTFKTYRNGPKKVF